ncbi:MAG: hypothetical protein EBR23_00640 [Planctomycetia bacterium]|jgi:hypothetical protein|nr:hypothetical protein [Planctomycetia bacterium]
MTTPQPHTLVPDLVRRPRLLALVILAAGLGLAALGAGGLLPRQVAAGDTSFLSQKCVLCGRAFAEKLAQLCSSCDRGKCFKCGAAFPSVAARLCSGCDKGKCVDCGRAFPSKAARLCNGCATK